MTSPREGAPGEGPPARRARDLAINVALSIASLTLFLGAAEAISRLKYSPKEIRFRSLMEYDKDKIYRLKSNTQGFFAGIMDVATNSFGCRDSEIPVEKTAGTFRVLVLGDSLSFGHGVPNEAPFPEALERRLSRGHPDYRFDVVNMGVPGYSAFQEYHDLKRGLELHPDVAILQFTLNDVSEPYLFYKRYGGRGQIPTMPEIIDVPYYHYVLSQRSAFYLFLKDMAGRIRFSDMSPKGVREKAKEQELYQVKNLVYAPDHPQIVEAWAEYLTWLQKMTDLAKRNDVEFLVLAMPFDFQLFENPQLDHPQRILARHCEENGVGFVDLLPALRRDLVQWAVRQDPLLVASEKAEVLRELAQERPEEVRRFWEQLFLDEDHPTILGHRYVAERLYPDVLRALEKKGLSQ